MYETVPVVIVSAAVPAMKVKDLALLNDMGAPDSVMHK